MHIKRIHEMVERLTECTKAAIDGDKVTVGQYPIGEVVDMIKDLCEAEYYAREAKAQEKEEEEDKKEEEYGRMFYPRRRDSRGRFMSNRGRYGFPEPPYIHMPEMEPWGRDMDMMDGRMYYDGGRGSSGGRTRQGSNDGGNRGTTRSGNSRYGFSHDEYLEKRKEHEGQDPENKRKRMELLDEYLEDLCDMSKEVVQGMTPEEKQMWKSKITKILNM